VNAVRVSPTFLIKKAMSYPNPPIIQSTGCCDPFNPEPWQDKEITWKDKIFVKDHVTNFLHIPFNMGKKIN